MSKNQCLAIIRWSALPHYRKAMILRGVSLGRFRRKGRTDFLSLAAHDLNKVKAIYFGHARIIFNDPSHGCFTAWFVPLNHQRLHEITSGVNGGRQTSRATA